MAEIVIIALQPASCPLTINWFPRLHQFSYVCFWSSSPSLSSRLHSPPPPPSLASSVCKLRYKATAPLLSTPFKTPHLLCMICITVTQVILGGLALISCFVIKGLTCWRERLCSELLNRLLILPGDRQPTSFSISLSLFFFLMDLLRVCQVFCSHILFVIVAFSYSLLLLLLRREKLRGNHCVMRDVIM